MVADEKVRGRTVTVRCRSCPGAITIGAPQAQEPEPTPPSVRPNPFDSIRAKHAPVLPANRESSQMFTLAALVGRATGPAPLQTPMPSVTPTASARISRREGSGVIDLNALTRAAEERARRVQSEPPPSAFARETFTEEAAPTMSRRIRFIGIGAAAAALAVVGLVIALSGGEEPKPVAAAAPPATQVAPPPPATVTPPPQPTPAPKAAVADDSAKDKDTKTAHAKGGKGGGRKAHGGAVSSGPKLTKVTSSGVTNDKTASAPPAPKKPPAGSDPCGCKGDLQCAIKCFK
jgi:hypothetical protein